MTHPSITGRLMAWAGPVFWLIAALCAPASTPKRVMILNPYGRDTAPFAAVAAEFRSTLAAELDEPIDFQEIPLDLTRFDEPGEEPLAAFLHERLARNPVDLVVPIGAAGVRFAARHHARLFPKTPILLTGAEPRMIPPGFIGDKITLVSQAIDLPGVIRDILRMKPETKHVAVVLGSSEIERHWAGVCRREFAPFSDQVDFIWLDGLSLGEMLDRCSNLPPDSFIFHGLFVEDADGIPCGKSESLRRLNAVASAPVFSLFASELGLGPTGGHLFHDPEVGVRAARTAARILRGESPGVIPPLILESGAPIYDWRELLRWNIPEANLPANRIIRFREPGFWDRYRWQALGAAVFCILQAALIVGLLVNRKKLHHAVEARHIAMRQTIELRDTLAHTGRVSLMGQLASALAHELSQPLGAILRNAEAAEIMLKQAAPDTEELRAIIDDILRDDHRAGGVINKLRTLLRKGKLDLQPLDLSEVVSDVLAMLQSDASARHVSLASDIEPGLPQILGDRIHVQQVLLNLMVNAMDAMDGRDDRAVRVFARTLHPNIVEVRVCDNGPGISADRIDRLFEPFYTTKADGMGMGLPVSKTIIEAHKGQLTAENRPHGGACFCFTLQTAAHQL